MEEKQKMKLVVATKNKGKIKEINSILGDMGITVLSQDDLNINVDVEENGAAFEENAMKKAKEIMAIAGEITLADDSGLEVDYLDGAPGIYSARYGGEGASDADKNNKLLKALEGVPLEERTARFVCVIAASFPDGSSFTVRGECEGRIQFEAQGENGFGYDPLFYIEEYKKTMAQLEPEIKNKISHRAKALELFKIKLQSHIT